MVIVRATMYGMWKNSVTIVGEGLGECELKPAQAFANSKGAKSVN